MNTPVQRSTAQIVRGRGIGARVGTLIGVGWMAYGISLLPAASRISTGIVGILIALILSARARKLIALSHTLPAPDDAARAANRRVWIKFWINLAAEIVLLNIAVNLLRKPELHVYWIPAISLVVGLHFLPMASFMRVPSYWICGGAMIAVAAVVAALLHRGVGAPPLLIALEALINAAILWATAAWALRSAAALGTANPSP